MPSMRAAVVSFSDVPSDPRVRRQVEMLVAEGWQVEVLGIGTRIEHARVRHSLAPIDRRRAGTVRYLYEYAAFFVWTALWVART